MYKVYINKVEIVKKNGVKYLEGIHIPSTAVNTILTNLPI